MSTDSTLFRALRENEIANAEARRRRDQGLGGALVEFGPQVVKDFAGSVADALSPFQYGVAPALAVAGIGSGEGGGTKANPPAQASDTTRLPAPSAPGSTETAGPLRSEIRTQDVATSAPAAPRSYIRYKGRDGQWHDYAKNDVLTGDRPESVGGTARSESDSYGGTARTAALPEAGSEGGYSSARMDSIPLGQRPGSYFQDKALEQALAQNEAQISLDKALTKDPFARERTLAQIDVGKQGAILGIGSSLRQQEERQRSGEFSKQASDEAGRRDEALARVRAARKAGQIDDQALKDAEGRIAERYEENVARLKEASGLGARMTSTGFYRGQ